MDLHTQLEDKLHELDSLQSRLTTHPEYSKRLQNSGLKNLATEAFKTSVNLEGYKFKTRNKIVKQTSQRALSYLRTAWDFLIENQITLDSLSALGGIIEPDSNDSRFRTGIVQFGEFNGEDPDKILNRMDNLVHLLNKNLYLHPVLKALEAHNTIISVHPYSDGNGRAGRLICNYLLTSKSYSPLIITKDEKPEYVEKLNEFHRDRYAGVSSVFKPSQNELELNSYMIEKILEQTKSLELELRKNRHYRLKINSKSPKACAKTIREYCRKHEDIYKTKLDEESHELLIVGDLSADVLREHLNSYRRNPKKKHKFKFELKTIY